MSDLLMKMPSPYEPLRKNRFLVRFATQFGIAEWWCKAAARPSLEINEVEIQFLNTSRWVLGRYTWASVSITLRDPIGPSASQAVMEMVRMGVESVTGRMGYAAGYKKDIELEMLDPGGVVVQKWILNDAMVTAANFGDLSMDDDGVAEIVLTIRPDYCTLLF